MRQLVIEVPDRYIDEGIIHTYQLGSYVDMEIRKAVQNSIALPKGHGDIIDADKLKYETITDKYDGYTYTVVKRETLAKAKPLVEKTPN